MTTEARVVERRHAAAPVYLMQVVVPAGERTIAHGALWDGVPAATDRARHLVDLAIRYGTITRTLARACPMTITLTINRGDPEEPSHAD